ncbi:MAG: exo-alpha-sialidase, partial [Candidatus Zixiibacteriota bacterium]
MRFARSTDEGQTWTIGSIDDGGGNNVGQYSSIAVAGGAIYVSYWDATAGDLKVAKSTNQGVSWAFGAVDTGNTNVVGQYTAVAATGNTVYVAYYDATARDLKFAKSTDGASSWTTSVVDDGAGNDVGSHAAIAVSGSTVYVSYYDATAGSLKLAKSVDSGTSWSISTIDSGMGNNVGQFSSIAVTSDAVYATYYDVTAQDYKLAKSTDGGTIWTVTSVDSPGNVGTFTSLVAVGSELFASYRDEGAGNVRFAYSGDAGGSFDISAPQGGSARGVGWFTSITGATDGRLFVSHYDHQFQDLRVSSSFNGGLTWTSMIVDSVGNVGEHTSIALTGTTVFVAYRDASLGNLKLAKSWNNGATWTTMTIDTGAGNDVGYDPSIEVVGNVVYITYYDATFGDLKIAKSTDGGASWITSIIDDGAGKVVGGHTSLAVTGGTNLYVSYTNFTDGDLMLAKSTDGGASWSVQTVDTNLNTGHYTSLAAVGDSVYIAYTEWTNKDLFFAKSTDAGSTWTMNFVAGGGPDVGIENSIAVKGSTLFISTYNAPFKDLNIFRSDNGGVNWSVVGGDGAGGFIAGGYSSMAVVNGNVYVAYEDGSLQALDFICTGDNFNNAFFGSCPPLHRVSYTVQGLEAGDAIDVTLKYDPGNPAGTLRETDFGIAADGSYAFDFKVPDTWSYQVEVFYVAGGRGKTCTVDNAAGQATATVAGIVIRCGYRATYSVAGMEPGEQLDGWLDINSGARLTRVQPAFGATSATFSDVILNTESWAVTNEATTIDNGKTCGFTANDSGSNPSSDFNVTGRCGYTVSYTIQGIEAGDTVDVTLKSDANNPPTTLQETDAGVAAG